MSTVSGSITNNNCRAVSAVSGIQCWKCNSREDPGCGDPFENNTYYKVECDKADERRHLPGVKATMCRKIRQKGENECRKIMQKGEKIRQKGEKIRQKGLDERGGIRCI